MKKAISILMVLVMGIVMTFALSACSDRAAEPPKGSDSNPSGSNWQNPSDDSSRPVNEDTKALVVYFSVPDNRDNSYVEINGERLGNTQYMAYTIQENTGANIFRILPKNPYPTDHDELLAVAQNEIRTNARPEIDGTIEDFDSYDVVFVGYPNWNADMPYILYTFFEAYDFWVRQLYRSIPMVAADFPARRKPLPNWSRMRLCWRARAFQETALKAQNRKLSTGLTTLVC